MHYLPSDSFFLAKLLSSTKEFNHCWTFLPLSLIKVVFLPHMIKHHLTNFDKYTEQLLVHIWRFRICWMQCAKYWFFFVLLLDWFNRTIILRLSSYMSSLFLLLMNHTFLLPISFDPSFVMPSCFHSMDVSSIFFVLQLNSVACRSIHALIFSNFAQLQNYDKISNIYLLDWINKAYILLHVSTNF